MYSKGREIAVEAIASGRSVVDYALQKYGYDSMEFALAREAWLETASPLRRMYGDDIMPRAHIRFQEANQ